MGCGLPQATHLPDPSSSPSAPGTVLGGSAGPFGTGEPVAAGSGVAGGGVDVGVRLWGQACPPPPHPPTCPSPAPLPGHLGRCWAALLASTGQGRVLQHTGMGSGGGGFIMWASDLGISRAPPPPQAPTCLDPSSSPRARGAVLGGSAGSFRTGEGFAGRFGVGVGGLFMWASGKRGCLREVCNPSQSVSNLREFFLAKIPVINTGIPLSQVSLSRTLENFSWPKFLL